MVYLSLTHDIQTQAEVLTYFVFNLFETMTITKKGKYKTYEHWTDKF